MQANTGSFTVGLTGGIGSGKSTIASLFARHGAAIIDVDIISHQLTARGGVAMPEIVAAFGSRIQQEDGALDRAAMRALIFNDPVAKHKLESILHPKIREESSTQLSLAQAAYAMLVVPLLTESSFWHTRCDRILVIDCHPALQIQRVMARNNLSEEEIKKIIAAQISREARLKLADDILDNTGSPNELPPRVAALHQRYLIESTKPRDKS